MKIIADLTDFLIWKGYIDPEDRDIYLYGFDIFFYTIWSTAVLLLIGLILRQFWAVVIICNLFWSSLLYAFSAAFLLAAISRIGGKLFNKEKATL